MKIFEDSQVGQPEVITITADMFLTDFFYITSINLILKKKGEKFEWVT